jgi:hypothetical protein
MKKFIIAACLSFMISDLYASLKEDVQDQNPPSNSSRHRGDIIDVDNQTGQELYAFVRATCPDGMRLVFHFSEGVPVPPGRNCISANVATPVPMDVKHIVLENDLKSLQTNLPKKYRDFDVLEIVISQGAKPRQSGNFKIGSNFRLPKDADALKKLTLNHVCCFRYEFSKSGPDIVCKDVPPPMKPGILGW